MAGADDQRPTIGALRADARRRLRSSPHAVDPREAGLLIALALGWPEVDVLRRDDEIVPADALPRIDDLVRRRASGVPYAYLAGVREFYGRVFRVDPRVLVPRPETEHVVEATLGLEPLPRRLLDLGTGSGCLALTLTLELAGCRTIASDLSAGALAVARLNRRELAREDPSLLHRCGLVGADLLAGIEAGAFDTIVSNPPYIGTDERLPATVREHEPGTALFAGTDGLSVYRRLLGPSSPLRRGQRVVLELGAGQRDRVISLARPRFEPVRTMDDLAGVERVLVLRHV